MTASSERQMVFDWRDVCPLCSVVLNMPEDGSSALHLCARSIVPWRRLAEARIITRRTLRLLLERVWRDDVLEEVYDGHPSQEGPFLPWLLPHPRLAGDLALWSAAQLREVYHLGRQAIRRIDAWLKERGLALATEQPRNQIDIERMISMLPQFWRRDYEGLPQRLIDLRQLRSRLRMGLSQKETPPPLRFDAQLPLLGRRELVGFPFEDIEPGETVEVATRFATSVWIASFHMRQAPLVIEDIQPDAALAHLSIDDLLDDPLNTALCFSETLQQRIASRPAPSLANYIRAGDEVRIHVRNPSRFRQTFSCAMKVVIVDEEAVSASYRPWTLPDNPAPTPWLPAAWPHAGIVPTPPIQSSSLLLPVPNPFGWPSMLAEVCPCGSLLPRATCHPKAIG